MLSSILGSKSFCEAKEDKVCESDSDDEPALIEEKGWKPRKTKKMFHHKMEKKGGRRNKRRNSCYELESHHRDRFH